MTAISSGPERTPGPWPLALLATLPALLLAVLVAIWDVGREAPPGYGCNEDVPPHHDAAVAAFRDGSVTWHAIAIVLGLLVVLALSATRNARGGRPVPGLPTVFAVVVALLALQIGLATDVGELIGLATLLPAAPGLLLAHPGAGGLALFAVLLLPAAAVLAGVGVRDGQLAWTAALVWWLIALAAGHLTLIQIAGSGPIAC